MGFLNEVLPDEDGWVPVITRGPRGGLTNFQWFAWPAEEDDLAEYAQQHAAEDLYFSPMLYTMPPTRIASTWATKDHVQSVAVVWADGDDCPLDKMRVKPTLTVATSENRWQGYWRLDPATTEGLTLEDWEDISRSVFIAHKDDGMDAGWPLAKKMRLPGSTNTKYSDRIPYRVDVKDDWSPLGTVRLDYLLTEYPRVERVTPADMLPEPSLRYTTQEAVDKVAGLGQPDALNLHVDGVELGQDRSKAMYLYECLLWEAGVSLEESYACMLLSQVNKFAQDGRDQETWPQMQRDYARWKERHDIVAQWDSDEATVRDRIVPSSRQDFSSFRADASGLYWSGLQLLSPEDPAVSTRTFVDMFVDWAQSRSKQSPWEFNMAGAVALLSATLSRYASVPLSFGDLGLNTYQLVLGRTTQSRKTTSLKLAEEVIWDLTNSDPDRYLVPSDATPEALAEHLAGKVSESSLFPIDEFQDTLTAAARKGSYSAGLIPFLTKAYDGAIPGVLRRTGSNKFRKTTRHYLSFYGTGILEQSARALTTERIESGFVPRCMIVTDRRYGFEPGADDVTVRRGGEDLSKPLHDLVLVQLLKAVRYWEERAADYLGAATVPGEDVRIPLSVDEDAFLRWQSAAYDLTHAAANHPLNPKAMFPTCERLSFSILKVAALLAMVDCRDTVQMGDVVKALSLGETWARCTEVLITEVCNNGLSRDIRAVEQYLAARPNRQASKAELMEKFENRFEDPKRLTEVLMYAGTKGTITNVGETSGLKGDAGKIYQYHER